MMEVCKANLCYATIFVTFKFLGNAIKVCVLVTFESPYLFLRFLFKEVVAHPSTMGRSALQGAPIIVGEGQLVVAYMLQGFSSTHLHN